MAQESATIGEVLEFWPDYGPGPLWRPGGSPAPPETLGISRDLEERLQTFNDAYREEMLPLDGAGDAEYIATGLSLLGEVRQALSGRFRVVATEPWWGGQSSE